MFHDLILTWFNWVQNWGYSGVFLLMALESTIVPVPSEIIIPPAAYWAAQGQMSLAGVVVAGTAGSYFGSILNYLFFRAVGLPFIDRYGKYLLIKPEKIHLASRWINQYGAMGVFIGRLLPVVRHLISIPAGFFRMDFWKFTLATVVGAGVWCCVLAWFGASVLGQHPELLNSPEEMMHVIKDELLWFVVAALILAGLYFGLVLKRGQI